MRHNALLLILEEEHVICCCTLITVNNHLQKKKFFFLTSYSRDLWAVQHITAFEGIPFFRNTDTHGFLKKYVQPEMTVTI